MIFFLDTLLVFVYPLTMKKKILSDVEIVNKFEEVSGGPEKAAAILGYVNRSWYALRTRTITGKMLKTPIRWFMLDHIKRNGK